MKVNQIDRQAEAPVGKAALWIGRILSAMCILFLLFDGITKIMRAEQSVKATAELGFSDDIIRPMGLWILAFTILYSIPRTAVFGAILLTAHLGGAVAIFIRHYQGKPYFLFSLVFCLLLWTGLYLQYKKLRSMVPFRRSE